MNNLISKTPRTDKASEPYARWTQPPVCGSVARQLELENRELRWLLKNPNPKQRLRRHRLTKRDVPPNEKLCEEGGK